MGQDDVTLALHCTKPLRVYIVAYDFKAIADELKRYGVSYVQQAEILGKPKQTIYNWTSGHHPNHADGDAFLRMYQLIVGGDISKFRTKTYR